MQVILKSDFYVWILNSQLETKNPIQSDCQNSEVDLFHSNLILKYFNTKVNFDEKNKMQDCGKPHRLCS